MSRRVVFLLFPGCEILDLAGPAQALHEATLAGDVAYAVEYCAETTSVPSAQGLEFCGLRPLPSVTAGDWVMIPGFPIRQRGPGPKVIRWLRRSAEAGARMASICTGAFLLGRAGLLDGKRCTTHWRRLDELQAEHPRARVIRDRLFVEDGNLITSAGIVAGIDMTLSMLEQDAGPAIASAVAREMVVYLRRDGSQQQESVYLDFRGHAHPSVHRLQDYLSRHPERDDTLEQLAQRFSMSGRNLSRLFRKATGMSVHAYRSRIRAERARTLLRSPGLTVDRVAAICGFSSGRQLRRLVLRQFGRTATGLREAL